MFNASFYPTPDSIARKMLAPYAATLRTRSILEPSAGKGDLCDAITRHSGTWQGEEIFKRTVHCCEIEPDLQATLRGKGYTLAGYDFLSFQPDEKYDLIVMNPPFRDGEKHLLHAWDILPHGDIVCLLNAGSMRNPLLERIIAEHGETEELGPCFEDAFRKTSVNVALVRLHKEAKPVEFRVFGGMEDRAAPEFADSGLGDQIATRDVVGNLVLTYDRARKVFEQLTPLAAELAFYAKQLAPKSSSSGWQAGFLKSVEDLFSAGTKAAEQTAACNRFTRSLKKDAWANVFEKTGARNLMSQKVKKDFDQQKEEMQRMAFSVENIHDLIFSLHDNAADILRRCILEAFDLMTSFDKKNKIHVEGWKTNDAWRVNRKVIVPICPWGGYETDYWADHGGLPYSKSDILDDIDRALAYLEGRKLENVMTICQAIKDFAFPIRSGTNDRRKNPDWTGTKFESEYFVLVGYKKGTLHMVFKDASLWEHFNMEAAKGKNWIPEDYKYAEKAAKKGAVVPAERGRAA